MEPILLFETGWEEKVAEMVRIRELARRRETTVGELVLGAARGALPAPHPDQWLPKAEKQRHEDEVGHCGGIVGNFDGIEITLWRMEKSGFLINLFGLAPVRVPLQWSCVVNRNVK